MTYLVISALANCTTIYRDIQFTRHRLEVFKSFKVDSGQFRRSLFLSFLTASSAHKRSTSAYISPATCCLKAQAVVFVCVPLVH